MELVNNKRSLTVRTVYRVTALKNKALQYFRIGWLKIKGAQIGKNNTIGKIIVPLAEQVIIGNNCVLEDNVRLRVGGPWKQGLIQIGDNTFLGHSTQINVGSHFKIGNDCMIAPLCIFSDANHSFASLEQSIKSQPCIYECIEIMDDVWIGSGSIILGGVKIGKGAVVAAGAVVTESIPDREVWGGIPARKLKSRKQ